MKLEVLYPQICNLYGDTFNIRYLTSCTSQIEVINTALTETPYFASNDVSMIYLGAMSEHSQELVINALMPYKERISTLIDNGTVFLCTGNSSEIFGKYIETDEGEKIEGLGLFDVYSVRRMMQRHNSQFTGKFEDITVVGFKSQFSMMYGDNNDSYFLKCEKGIGINPDSKLEGIRRSNFFGTYLIGPLLILNPELTRYFLELIGSDDYKLKYSEELKSAYTKRLDEFMRQ